MENSTQVVSFVLTMYGNIGNLRYLYFILAMLLYIFVIFVNAVVIVIIFVDINLHEPMYLILCGLLANEIYGSTSLLPCLMAQILSDTHEISVFYCHIQIFCIHTYAGVEYSILTVMAYDRYVCICKPLHYNVIVTKRKIQKVIVAVWIYIFVEVGILLSFTIRLKLCGNTINQVFCSNYLVTKLSCSLHTEMSHITDLVFGLVFTVAVPTGFISFTYIKILGVCLNSSTETKQKAVSTCTPHLVSLLNFSFGCFYDLITQRIDLSFVPYPLHGISSMYILICQPLLSPIMYGLKLSKIRHACQNFVASKML
ncbi:olfactory receptor 4K1-like [Myripristis murdjan]|uniref:olfactory receptor 4K1-like n=1 Tax=Myripristis murdjan TaxID=586833 RepID=UPI0011762538|nr:olfactory receptor 4K1-like [Myripristis murdjan]